MILDEPAVETSPKVGVLDETSEQPFKVTKFIQPPKNLNETSEDDDSVKGL